MVVLPVMAAINFNQNTLEREKSGLGSYMLCGCTIAHAKVTTAEVFDNVHPLNALYTFLSGILG